MRYVLAPAKPMSQVEFYQTATGSILRVTKSDDGHLKADVWRAAAWQEGKVGMVGLRRAEGTRRLTERQVARLTETEVV